MKIGKMVAWAATAMMLILLICGVMGTFSINEIRMGGPIDRRSQQASDLLADIVPPTEFVVEPYLEAAKLAKNSLIVDDVNQRVTRLKAAYDARYKHWINSDIDPEAKRAIINGTHPVAARFWQELQERMIPAARMGDEATLNESFAELTRLFEEHRAKVDEAVQLARKYRTHLDADATQRLNLSLILLATAATVLLLLVGGFCGMVIARIVRPLTKVTRRMQEMAEGHFPTDEGDIKRRDEIGDVARALQGIVAYVEERARQESEREMAVQQKTVAALGTALQHMAEGDLRAQLTGLPPSYSQIAEDFHHMRFNFGNTIRQMSDTAGIIFTGTKEISSAADDLSARIERQAAALARTAETIRETTQAIQTTAANARQVDSSVAQANAQAQQGGEVVECAIGAMDKIKQSSEEIAKVIAVIEAIAFQTNMLALNASVEAARAGDAGQGFAVVASEVRALAHRTAESAQAVKGLIIKSRDDVQEGVVLVGKTGTALEQIIQKISEVTAQTQEITGFAQTQATRMEQISAEIVEMDVSTQQNAAMVEQSSAAVRALFDEANSLSDAVGRFITEHRAELRRPEEEPIAGMMAVDAEEAPRMVAHFR